MIYTLIALLVLLPLAAPMELRADQTSALETTGESTAAVSAWGGGLAIDPRVLTEVNSFRSGGDRLPDGYAEALARDVRAAVFAATTESLRRIVASEATPFVEVSYPEPGFARVHRQAPDQHSVVADFEKGFILTEGIALIDGHGTSAAEALDIYLDRAFRKSVSSRVERLWDDGGLDCIETSGIAGLLSPTHCCNRVSHLLDGLVAAEHAQVVSNGDTDKFQPFYFKESVKTFIELPDGRLALYYINYTRSVKLGRIKRALGTGQVRASQQKRFDALQEHLDARAASDSN